MFHGGYPAAFFVSISTTVIHSSEPVAMPWDIWCKDLLKREAFLGRNPLNCKRFSVTRTGVESAGKFFLQISEKLQKTPCVKRMLRIKYSCVVIQGEISHSGGGKWLKKNRDPHFTTNSGLRDSG